MRYGKENFKLRDLVSFHLFDVRIQSLDDFILRSVLVYAWLLFMERFVEGKFQLTAQSTRGIIGGAIFG
jgi:hypothetical protein